MFVPALLGFRRFLPPPGYSLSNNLPIGRSAHIAIRVCLAIFCFTLLCQSPSRAVVSFSCLALPISVLPNKKKHACCHRHRREQGHRWLLLELPEAGGHPAAAGRRHGTAGWIPRRSLGTTTAPSSPGTRRATRQAAQCAVAPCCRQSAAADPLARCARSGRPGTRSDSTRPPLAPACPGFGPLRAAPGTEARAPTRPSKVLFGSRAGASVKAWHSEATAGQDAPSASALARRAGGALKRLRSVCAPGFQQSRECTLSPSPSPRQYGTA